VHNEWWDYNFNVYSGISWKPQPLAGMLIRCLVVLIVCTTATAAEVQLGQAREEVVAILGIPQGRLKDHGVETLIYPRGEVTLTQGLVTQIQLMSIEEYRKWSTAELPLDTVKPVAPPIGRSSDPESPNYPAASQSVDITNNIVIVRARLNNLAVRLALDTGAAMVAVTPPMAEAAGVIGSKDAKLIDATGEQEHVRLATANSVAVGPALIHDVPVMISDMTPAALQSDDGQLGLSFLTNFLFRIDYQRKQLSFPSLATLPKAGSAIPLQYIKESATKSGVLTVQLEVDGIPARFLVDTGKSGTLSLESWFVEKMGLRRQYQMHPSGASHSILGVEQQEATYLRTLKFGSYTLINLPTVFRQGGSLDSDLAGAIGGGIFRLFTVTFDIAGQQLWLEPNDSFFWQTLAWRTGLGIGRDWAVKSLTPDSRAALAGLRVGDHILEIDGRPSQSLSRAAYEKALSGKPGTRLPLRVQTGRESARLVMLILP